MTLIAAALAPFYVEFRAAKYHARSAPAVNDLIRNLLSHRLLGVESVEISAEFAKETLSKVTSLLDGSEIWSFPGCEPPSNSEKMAA